MAIKKRKPKRINPPLKKKPIKKSPKRQRHERKCDDLCNRLLRDTDDDTRAVMKEITGLDMSAHLWCEVVMGKFDTQVSTLQINGGYGHGGTYRCFMTYTDYDKKPQNGWLYPRVSVVKTSTRLIHSVILSYIALSKQLGHFP